MAATLAGHTVAEVGHVAVVAADEVRVSCEVEGVLLAASAAHIEVEAVRAEVVVVFVVEVSVDEGSLPAAALAVRNAEAAAGHEETAVRAAEVASRIAVDRSTA